MTLFAIAFFGASLLFPLYFQQVRGETALRAGLLLAPQGVGAMITMPIAGILADRIGPGKIVLAGIAVITVGMAMFTQIERGHVLRVPPRRALRHGPRHGRHDDADHDRGAATLTDHTSPAARPDEHHPAGRGLDGHRAVLGAAHQRAQGQGRRCRSRRPPTTRARWPAVAAAARPVAPTSSGACWPRCRATWPTRSRPCSSSPRSWSPAAWSRRLPAAPAAGRGRPRPR